MTALTPIQTLDWGFQRRTICQLLWLEANRSMMRWTSKAFDLCSLMVAVSGITATVPPLFLSPTSLSIMEQKQCVCSASGDVTGMRLIGASTTNSCRRLSLSPFRCPTLAYTSMVHRSVALSQISLQDSSAHLSDNDTITESVKSIVKESLRLGDWSDMNFLTWNRSSKSMRSKTNCMSINPLTVLASVFLCA